MQLSIHYTELTPKEAVVDYASLLSCISHEAFPFVFGVVFGFWSCINCLFWRFVELQKGLNIHLPFIELFNQKVYVSVKCHGYTFECTGIVHNDIKGDNILTAKVNFGESRDCTK